MSFIVTFYTISLVKLNNLTLSIQSETFQTKFANASSLGPFLFVFYYLVTLAC